MTLKEVMDMKKDYAAKKLKTQEIEKVNREARLFIRDASEYIQRKNLASLEKKTKKK